MDTYYTGAAGGLGRAIALELAERGYSLVLHYRTKQSQAEELSDLCHQKKVKAHCIQGDFSSTESTMRFIERYLAAFEKTQFYHQASSYIVALLFRRIWHSFEFYAALSLLS